MHACAGNGVHRVWGKLEQNTHTHTPLTVNIEYI